MRDLLIKNVDLQYAKKMGGLTLRLYCGIDNAIEASMVDALTGDCLGFCKVQEVPPHGDLIDENELRERAYVIQIRDRISFQDALTLALMDAPTVIEGRKER